MTYLGQYVKELRIKNGLTQRQLADRAGVGQDLITSLESGRRKYVSAYHIEALARGLMAKEDDLWAFVPGGKSTQKYIAIGI